MKRSIATQEFRFNLGRGYLSLVNFVLLIIAIADKISVKLGVRERYVISGSIILAFIGCWFLGYVIDESKFYEMQVLVKQERSIHMERILKAVSKDEEKR